MKEVSKRYSAFNNIQIATLALVFSLGFMMLQSCKKNNTGTGTGGTTPTPNPPPSPAWDVNAMRGVWITTTASTALDNNDNILQTVDNCKKAGINNIFLVVYNNARTIYPSDVMFKLTGNRQLEKFQGRDPLKEMITAAKAAGIKVHAWFEYG
ncbi:MAG: hypothetical protein RL394_422, partial [Bacteroidota bacterium]